MKKRIILVLPFFLLLVTSAFATVIPNSLFADNMVLQRGVAVPIWGKADDNEVVTVTFGKQKVTAKTTNGKWMATLKPLKEGGPFTMTIAGTNTITINNILVGEVWICSGQSNMERQLGLRPPQKPILNWESEAAAANYPEIREYAVPHNTSTKELEDAKGKWSVCTPENVVKFSAVGYFFGSELYKHLKVPIGLIHSSVGGTPAENWTSRAALEKNPELTSIVTAYDKAVQSYPALLDSFKTNEPKLIEKWIQDTLKATELKKPIPRKPAPPQDPIKRGNCGGLYHAMIAPLVPYAIKGVIWYQGESNSGNGKLYRTLFPYMINSWRATWNEGDFPFLFVQIAPFKSNTPELREAQLFTAQKVPNTAMVVTTDCGDTLDIHPTNKRPVGERLALAARAIAYKEKLEYSGPIYASMQQKGSKIELSFTHTGSGLMLKDSVLKGFTIAGSDKVYQPATAIIQGNKVIVSCDAIPNPANVRYGWKNNADVNLFNKEGLPASPFRTDVE